MENDNYIDMVTKSYEAFMDIKEDINNMFLNITSIQAKLDSLENSNQGFYFSAVSTMFEKGTDYQGKSLEAINQLADLNFKFVEGILKSYDNFYVLKIPDVLVEVILHTLLDKCFIHNMNPSSLVKITEILFEKEQIITVTLALIRYLVAYHNQEKTLRWSCKEKSDYTLRHLERTTMPYASACWTDMKELLDFYTTYRKNKDGVSVEEDLFVVSTYNATQKFKFSKAGLTLINSDEIRNWGKELTWKKVQ